MYVCLCNAVRESDIHAAVENGVRTMRELIMATGCSSSCKKCARTAAEVLDEAVQGKRPPLQVLVSSQVA